MQNYTMKDDKIVNHLCGRFKEIVNGLHTIEEQVKIL